MRVRCDSCEDFKYLKSDEVKNIHPELAFYCSKPCVLEALKVPGEKFNGLDTTPVEDQSDRHVESWALKTCFKTMFEMRVAEWLTELDYEWYYELYAIEFSEDGDRRDIWIPDFVLPTQQILIEVKGKWNQGQKKKMGRFLRAHPHVKVVAIQWAIRDEFYNRRRFV